MPKDDDLLEKIQDLQTEVDNLKLKVVQEVIFWHTESYSVQKYKYVCVHPFLLELSEQQSVTGVEAQVVEQCIEQKQALIRECNRHHEKLHHLHALTRIKADERDQKSRELLKAQV